MTSRLSLAALIAGGMMVATSSANAADLGGDCCADLEERVATLEATTARKGNRKVSLKIYGHVNQALLIWDDGEESDAYIVDNDHSSTRIGFKGKAKINSDWSAGYKIELQFESSSSASVTATNDDADNLDIRKSFMYVKSKQLGKISWGLNSVATDDVTHDAFKHVGLTNHARPDFHYVRQFNFRNADGTQNALARVGELCGAAHSDSDACFDIGSRRNSIRYDTPTFAGFKLSAAWGEDDFWDVALRYKGKFDQFKVAASIGYSEWDPDPKNTGGEEDNANGEESFAGSASIMHTPTGIFVNGSYRNTEVTFGNQEFESDSYYIQAGIQQKWNSLGKTTIYGEYANSEDGLLTSANNFNAATLTGSELERWGIGITQNIDAAAMQLYVVYQHHEAEIDGSGADLQDIDNVVIGGTIKF